MKKLDKPVSVLRARLLPKHVERMEQIAQATGLNVSAIFRQLIENAEVKPVTSNQVFSEMRGKMLS